MKKALLWIAAALIVLPVTPLLASVAYLVWLLFAGEGSN